MPTGSSSVIYNVYKDMRLTQPWTSARLRVAGVRQQAWPPPPLALPANASSRTQQTHRSRIWTHYGRLNVRQVLTEDKDGEEGDGMQELRLVEDVAGQESDDSVEELADDERGDGRQLAAGRLDLA